MNGVEIILVHTGTIFPIYILDCISNLNKLGFRIHLLISKKLINSVDHLCDSIEIFFEEDLVGDMFSEFETNLDKNFRDGFWFRTVLRFFLIYEYAKFRKMENFFHIENDVLIYDNLINIRDTMIGSGRQMGLVMDSIYRCIPSILFFSNFEICSKLVDFIKKNPDVDDMRLIADFFHNHRDVCLNFPILPSIYKSGHSIDFSNFYDEFECIFDGAALGQFLGGVDPRNDFGSTIGFVNEQCIFDVSKFSYIFENGKPYMVTPNGLKIKIINLHIHSKNLKKFLSKNV